MIFTVGYAPHTPESFLEILKSHGITALADVRSSPYSRHKPEFTKNPLRNFLADNGISYVFLGDCCGGRPQDPQCYADGRVDYSLVAETSGFREGLERIKKGMEKYRIVLMCAEKDPLDCHRTILVCRNLASSGIRIRHILEDGSVEDHGDAEQRLMGLFGLHQPDLVRSEGERLEEAYSRQEKKITFRGK